MPPLTPPPATERTATPALPPRTPKQQSWGTIISLLIIVAMIVVGAFYAWGKRIAAEQALIEAASSTASY